MQLFKIFFLINVIEVELICYLNIVFRATVQQRGSAAYILFQILARDVRVSQDTDRVPRATSRRCCSSAP